MYLLGGHPYPIEALHWRARDDFLLVSCADGTVYVWQVRPGDYQTRAHTPA